MLCRLDTVDALPRRRDAIDAIRSAQDFGDGEKNPNLITPEKYNELVKKHVMFKDMAADTYLASAGIADDWPYGRGCWQSDDKQCIVWFGEEDQLRIMCMKRGTKLNEVFDRLKKMLDTIEFVAGAESKLPSHDYAPNCFRPRSIDGIDFATSSKYGYVTSCPSNLGTGMRASVHVKIPNLTADGTEAKAKAVCKPLGLSVRGTGGEHTPIGTESVSKSSDDDFCRSIRFIAQAPTAPWTSRRRSASSSRSATSSPSSTRASRI